MQKHEGEKRDDLLADGEVGGYPGIGEFGGYQSVNIDEMILARSLGQLH